MTKPEERAAAIVGDKNAAMREVSRYGPEQAKRVWDFLTKIESEITHAITQAENAALEDAAAASAGAVLQAYDRGFERGDLASVAANACRSLKTKD